MAKTVFRPLDGILLLDKPAGYSSNQALQDVRRLFRAEKGGHTGALDPLATGLLPLCFGEATKIAGLLLGGRKAYRARIRLGTTTDTDDADGLVLRERPVPALDRATVEAALAPVHGPHPPAAADLFGAQAGRRTAVHQGPPRRGDRRARARGRGARRSSCVDLRRRPAAPWT